MGKHLYISKNYLSKCEDIVNVGFYDLPVFKFNEELLPSYMKEELLKIRNNGFETTNRVGILKVDTNDEPELFYFELKHDKYYRCFIGSSFKCDINKYSNLFDLNYCVLDCEINYDHRLKEETEISNSVIIRDSEIYCSKIIGSFICSSKCSKAAIRKSLITRSEISKDCTKSIIHTSTIDSECKLLYTLENQLLNKLVDMQDMDNIVALTFNLCGFQTIPNAIHAESLSTTTFDLLFRDIFKAQVRCYQEDTYMYSNCSYTNSIYIKNKIIQGSRTNCKGRHNNINISVIHAPANTDGKSFNYNFNTADCEVVIGDYNKCDVNSNEFNLVQNTLTYNSSKYKGELLELCYTNYDANNLILYSFLIPSLDSNHKLGILCKTGEIEHRCIEDMTCEDCENNFCCQYESNRFSPDECPDFRVMRKSQDLSFSAIEDF